MQAPTTSSSSLLSPRVAWTEPRTQNNLPLPHHWNDRKTSRGFDKEGLRFCQRVLRVGKPDERPEGPEIRTISLDLSYAIQIATGRLVYLFPPTTLSTSRAAPFPEILPPLLADTLVKAAETRSCPYLPWTAEYESLYALLPETEWERLRFDVRMDLCGLAEWKRRDGELVEPMRENARVLFTGTDLPAKEKKATMDRLAARRKACYALYEVRQLTLRRATFDEVEQDPLAKRYLWVRKGTALDLPAELELDPVGFAHCSVILSIHSAPPSSDAIPFDPIVHPPQLLTGELIFPFPLTSSNTANLPPSVDVKPLLPPALSSRLLATLEANEKLVWYKEYDQLLRELSPDEWDRRAGDAWIAYASYLEWYRRTKFFATLGSAYPAAKKRYSDQRRDFLVLYELYSRLDAEERRPRDGGYTAAAVQETTSSQKNGLFGAFRKLATDLSDPVLTAPGVPPPVYVPEESEQQQQRSTEGVLVEV